MLIYKYFLCSDYGGKRAGKFIGVMKQCIFAGKPVLKIILCWKGLVEGYRGGTANMKAPDDELLV